MQKRKRRSEGGWWKQTDVAGGLKCSSRVLPLEFAGNRTGLLGAGWGGGWCGGVCLSWFVVVCHFHASMCLSLHKHMGVCMFSCVWLYICVSACVCVCVTRTLA